MKIRFKINTLRDNSQIKQYIFEPKRQKSWFISYLDKEGMRKNMESEGLFDKQFEVLDSMKDETALVIKTNKKIKCRFFPVKNGRLTKSNDYFILTGDWREQYSRCKTRKECINLFKQNRNNAGNFWSN